MQLVEERVPPQLTTILAEKMILLGGIVKLLYAQAEVLTSVHGRPGRLRKKLISFVFALLEMTFLVVAYLLEPYIYIFVTSWSMCSEEPSQSLIGLWEDFNFILQLLKLRIGQYTEI